MSERDDKLGLALSGGGFRASFFHIGVLARLAELKLLRRVEVISAVSGGAIIAALYYLHVKKLLEERPDDEIDDEDYVAIVRCIERDFLAGVQKNVRMRAFCNPLKNLKMALATYSRSDRLGELFDEIFYRPVLAPTGTKPIEMRELPIRPCDGPVDFHPRKHNRRRRAKAPILILNATALNTGHNWRFEASRMGEPPRDGRVWDDVDKNMRLARPMSYAAITPRQQDIELGLAVAASACVPGIFAPLAISGLYDRGVRVQLVDGGVHDNQGVQGLLDEGCTHFVISDASGQMSDETDLNGGDLSVVVRANEILMDRLREEQLAALLAAHGKRSAFVHLRKGLAPESVGFIDRGGNTVRTGPAAATTTKRFGVDPLVQHLLSLMRTDLDSFTEIEARSLMLDAYLMSGPEIERVFARRADAANARWDFLAMRGWMRRPTRQYLRHLEAGQSKVCKVFRLSLRATAAAWLLGAAAVVGAGYWKWEAVLAGWNGTFPVPVKPIAIAALTLALGFVPVASRSFKILRFLRAPSEYAVRTAMRGILPAIGSLFVLVDLLTLDRLFLRLGRIARLAPAEQAETPLPEETEPLPEETEPLPEETEPLPEETEPLPEETETQLPEETETGRPPEKGL